MIVPQDYHIHSCFSEDSSASIEQVCLQAVALGIPEIGFSEHWGVGPYEKHPRFLKPQAWFSEIVRVRALFSDQLMIRTGIEISEPHLYPCPAAELFSAYPFDYVIGSVHWVGQDFMFDERYFVQRTADEVYAAYFAELEKMVSQASIDIVGHFDIPVRTAKPILGYSPIRYQDLILPVLKVMIERGLSMDVNTAGLRKPSRVLMPDPIILQWYARMGGKHVTLGSDAHTAQQVGSNLDLALQAVLDAGFDHVTLYELRQPILKPVA